MAAKVTTLVGAALRSYGVAGHGVLVAVSGGIDSTVLLHALHACAGTHALRLAVGHVNHGLRGEASEGDEAAVRAGADALEIPYAVRRVEPGSLRVGVSKRERPTVQEAARKLRYAALLEMAKVAGADWVATAHNADDQAETVLLRVLRGCGPDGLAGIPGCDPTRGVVRPLLRATREDVVEYAASEGLAWREDGSNRDPRYARNRIRRSWIPALARDFNPQLLRTLVHLAEAHRRDAEWMDSLVVAEYGRRCRLVASGSGAVVEIQVSPDDAAALPAALLARLLRRALHDLGSGRDVRRIHLDRMARFLAMGRDGTAIELPGPVRLRRAGHTFALERGEVDSRPAC